MPSTRRRPPAFRSSQSELGLPQEQPFDLHRHEQLPGGSNGRKALAKELNGKGSVVVYSIPGQENLEERLEGLKRVLARNRGIKILQVVNIAR